MIDVVGDGSMTEEGTGSFLGDDPADDPVDDPADDPVDDPLKEPENPGKLKESGPTRRVSVGKCLIEPSSSDFFNIDFPSMFVSHDPRNFSCRSCDATYNSRPNIVDHVWASHHQGKWKCPYCQQLLPDRYRTLGHIRTVHFRKYKRELRNSRRF